MYSLLEENVVKRQKLVYKTNMLDFKGFFLGSNKKTFKIKSANIYKLCVTNKKLIYPLVSKKVNIKYEKIIEYS